MCVKRFFGVFFIFFTYGSGFSRTLFSKFSRTVLIFHVDFFFNFHVLGVNFHAHKNVFFHARLFIFTHRISDNKKNKNTVSKLPYFFTRTWTLVINSFISENCVSAKREEKKECFFSFPEEKFIGHLIRFWWSSFFYIKVACVFFSGFLCCFIFFLFHGKVQRSFIHSIFGTEKKGKKIAFSFIHSIFLINAQKGTFPGK